MLLYSRNEILKGGVMNKLKEKRLEKNLTLNEVGKMLNLKPNTISQYENAKRKVSINIAKRLAEIYQCKIDDLI